MARKATETRLDRARKIISEGKVYQAHGYDGTYVVVNGQHKAYILDTELMACGCPDMVYRGGDHELGECKHLLAVRLARGETVAYPNVISLQKAFDEIPEPIDLVQTKVGAA